MCIVGVVQCPHCESEYSRKSHRGTEVTLTCPNGHTWTVTNANNIGEFYPELAP